MPSDQNCPFVLASSWGEPDSISGVRQYIPGGKTKVRRAGTPDSMTNGSDEKSKLAAATSRRPSATVTSSAEFDSISPPPHDDTNATLKTSPSGVRSIDSASSSGSAEQVVGPVGDGARRGHYPVPNLVPRNRGASP